MKPLNGKTGSISNFLVALICLTFGIIYLFKNSFMPYHSEAVSLSWANIETDFRYLILALMKATSGGFIVTAVLIAWLQIRFLRKPEHWISLMILVAGCITGLALLYATLIIRVYTPGNPPTMLNVLMICLLLVGYIFNRKSLSGSQDGSL